MILANISLLIPAVLLILAFTAWLILRDVFRRKVPFSNVINASGAADKRAFLRRLPDALKLAALILLAAALLRPQEVKQETRDKIKGIDIMLALDVSDSMQADDLVPDRISAAKDVLAKFVSGLTSDRAGLVVFAGTARNL